MGSIRIRIDIAADGTITGKAPPGLPPGAREVHIPVADAPAPQSQPLDWPIHRNCGPWPEGLTLRREDLYGDDGR